MIYNQSNAKQCDAGSNRRKKNFEVELKSIFPINYSDYHNNRKLEDSRMQLIRNSQVVEQACQQFIEPHPCLYNPLTEIGPLMLSHPHLSYTHAEVSTSISTDKHTLNNRIRLNIIHNSKGQDNVIVYLHGLSSYCMEGKFLIPLLGDQFSLCLFDSRAHGKNKSKFVTYGLLQSQELTDIVHALRQKGYANIILWGRSMGAVTALRFLQQLSNTPHLQHIKYVVADAPFSSFMSIATDIVSNLTKLPQFLASLLAEQFSEKIKQLHGIDLKELNLEVQFTSPVPVGFLYSSKDELMGDKQIKNILKRFKGDHEAHDILVAHNDERPAWVISKLMANIRDKVKPRNVLGLSQAKRRGLSITKYCEDRLKFSKTPTPFSQYENIPAQNFKSSKIDLSYRGEIPPRVPKVMKENKPNIVRNLKGSMASFRGELGGSKAGINTVRMNPYSKNRKITVCQFFDE